MPSNAMKISQLLYFLNNEMMAHGDLDCILQVTELGAPVALDGSNIIAAVELPNARLNAPALVFGMYTDSSGVRTNSPGQRYEVSDDGSMPGDWNHDRAAAPADKTPLRVWKRFLGEDRGYRDGDDWYVYEGGDKAVQIVPAGILGWRLDG